MGKRVGKEEEDREEDSYADRGHLLLGLLLGSVVFAQGTTEMTAATAMETTPGDLAPSGGQSLLLPAAALLLGTGVLTYAVLRRRV